MDGDRRAVLGLQLLFGFDEIQRFVCPCHLQKAEAAGEKGTWEYSQHGKSSVPFLAIGLLEIRRSVDKLVHLGLR